MILCFIATSQTRRLSMNGEKSKKEMRARRRLQNSISRPAAYESLYVSGSLTSATNGLCHWLNRSAFIILHKSNIDMAIIIPCAYDGCARPFSACCYRLFRASSISCSSAFIALFWHCFEFCQLTILDASQLCPIACAITMSCWWSMLRLLLSYTHASYRLWWRIFDILLL